MKNEEEQSNGITREAVYEIIDSERDYQEKLWNNLNKSINNPSSFILWMEDYLATARHLASTTDERPGTDEGLRIMDFIRKVTALGVACMEINGAEPRRTYGGSSSMYGSGLGTPQ